MKTVMRNRVLLALLTVVGSVGILSCVTFLCASIGKHHLEITFRPLFQRSRWDDAQKEFASTYYERECTVEDLSTRNASDMMATADWTVSDAVDKMMTHGALVFPNLVDSKTADHFRDYTIAKNANLKPEDSVFVMNTHTKKLQTRWSFAFGPADHPSIPKLLQQVSSNPLLKDTLEAFLGSDPAIIKMQTITAGYKAEHQGWHPDVNARSSVLSHSRNFMMHFSLFVPLQDTSMKMGATGICPGSHFCAEVEEAMQDSCIQVSSGTNSTAANAPPIWKVGDAVLMNQNTWHRGWQHSKWGAPDRAMSVITFTSRPSFVSGIHRQRPFEMDLPPVQSNANSGRRMSVMHQPSSHKVETRSLSLGSPLSSFGFTFYDLQDPGKHMLFPWSFFRFFGLFKPDDAHWGWDWISSVFTRISVESNGFKRDDLKQYLNRLQNGGLPLRFLLRFLLESNVPKPDENRGVWEVWVVKSLAKAQSFSWRASWRCLSIALFLWHWLGRIEIATHQTTSSRRRVGQAWALLIAVALGTLLIGEVVLRSSSLVRGIQSGEKLRRPFPSMTNARMEDGIGDQVAVPTRADVLIGTRFHSPSLLMANRIFDYHPQNRAFRRGLRSIVEQYGFRHAHAALQDHLRSKFERTFSGTRFLLQSPHTGNFTRLSSSETTSYIKRTLESYSHPLLQELEESILFMISAIRFESKERETAMAFVTVNMLEAFQKRFFHEDDKHDRLPLICPSSSWRFRSFQIPTHFNLLPVATVPKSRTTASSLPVSSSFEAELNVAVVGTPMPKTTRRATTKPPPVRRRRRRNRNAKIV